MAIDRNESFQPGKGKRQQDNQERDDCVGEENVAQFGMKKYIVLIIFVFIVGLFIPSPLDNQESVEFLFNNVTIRYHKTKRMFFDWLIVYLTQNASGNQQQPNQQQQSSESVVEDQPNSNQNVNSENVNAKPEELPQEILKLLGQAFQDSSKTANQVASDIATQVNSLKFEEYDERNLCDVNKGIPRNQFNITVHEIGDFLNLPDDLVKIIVRSEKFNDQKQSSVESKTFKGKDGFLYFGKFVIARTKGSTVAFAYSLHGIKFALAPKSEQSSTLNASFISFTEKIMKEGVSNDTALVEGKTEEKATISKEAIKGFINHYLHETYEHFINNCKGHLDMLEGIEREDSKTENHNEKNSKETKADGEK